MQVQENGELVPDEASSQELSQVVEAVIFAADRPVPPNRLGAVYASVTGHPEPDAETVDAVVEGLNEAYEAEGRVFRIHAWGGGYRMATLPVLAPFLKTFFAEDRQKGLSRSLLETLAVVAYRQPVTRPEVDFVRGVSADYALRRLMEYGLVDVKGRSDAMGRPLLYGTTDRFLEQFGLAELDELPTLREIEELLDDPRFNRERAQLLTLKDARREEHEQEASTDDS